MIISSLIIIIDIYITHKYMYIYHAFSVFVLYKSIFAHCLLLKI